MAKAPEIVYCEHPAVARERSFLENMKEKTGRMLEEWFVLLEGEALDSEREAVRWLKEHHGVGTNYAQTIARRALGKAEDYDPEELVENLYSGPKAALRPIGDALVALGLGLGDDVRACPCKTFVPLYRRHVFAQVKPTTRTRIDFGLALGETPAGGRLLATGGLAKGDRITHRIPIASLAEIDAEVEGWLQRAYQADA